MSFNANTMLMFDYYSLFSKFYMLSLQKVQTLSLFAQLFVFFPINLHSVNYNDRVKPCFLDFFLN